MLVNLHLMESLSRRSCRTGCGIVGIIILSISSGLDLLMMRALEKVPDWYPDFPWIPSRTNVHMLEEYCWGHNLECNDTLYCAKIALRCTSILGRLRFTCQVSSYWYRLSFTTRKATGSAILWNSILIWHVLYDFLIAIEGIRSSFKLFRFGSGCWLYCRRLFVLVSLLNWRRHCRKIIRCPWDTVWL